MVKGGGDYLFPLAYTSPTEEHLNVRTNVGMQDLTSMGEVDLKGPGAERLLDGWPSRISTTCSPARCAIPPSASPTAASSTTSPSINSATNISWSSPGHAPRKKTSRWIAEHAAGTGAYVNDVSGAIALISVQGPRSRGRDFSAGVVAEPAALLALKLFRFAPDQIGDTELLVYPLQGYTGELGYELYVPAEEAALLWETLERRGKEFGLLPYGTAAMQEPARARKPSPAGPDVDGERDPLRGRTAALDRAFPNGSLSAAMPCSPSQGAGTQPTLGRARRFAGTTRPAPMPRLQPRRPTALPRDAPHRQRGRWKLRRRTSERRPVSRVTSSAKGHSVGKLLALAYVNVSHSWPGAQLMVDANGRPTPATVVPTLLDPQATACAAPSCAPWPKPAAQPPPQR
jgi:aminomethyltransferase